MKLLLDENLPHDLRYFIPGEKKGEKKVSGTLSALGKGS
jgi:hypothetical protein